MQTIFVVMAHQKKEVERSEKKTVFLCNILFSFEREWVLSVVPKQKIKTIEDFDEVRSFVEKNNGLETVAIINIMLIGKEWR